MLQQLGYFSFRPVVVGLDGNDREHVVDQNNPVHDWGAIQSKNGRARTGFGSQVSFKGSLSVVQSPFKCSHFPNSTRLGTKPLTHGPFSLKFSRYNPVCPLELYSAASHGSKHWPTELLLTLLVRTFPSNTRP